VQYDPKELMPLFMDYGEALLASGGEVRRLEDTMDYLAEAYGGIRVDAFAISSLILLTVDFGEGGVHSISRCVPRWNGTDFEKLELLNRLSRTVSRAPLSPQEFRAELDRISQVHTHPVKNILGSGLAAGAFAMFFGGGILEGLLAFFFGLVALVLQFYFAPRMRSRVSFLFVVSLLSGLGIYALGLTPLPVQCDMVVIGVIMLLVPGIAVTTAVRDLFIGDTVTGSSRLMESIIGAAAMAAGYMLSMILFAGGVL